ncbi:vitamin K epoxide reductase family protein [Candidatus Azambacteria bacterium]|nr:vitamin K epoxide reductase family protein [Candidatus Azambacteria bacterium]
MRNSKITKAIFALAIFGIFITSYSLYDHYKPMGDSVCNVSEVINCDIVNKGPYSELFGIPQALLGILFYIFIAALAYLILSRKPEKSAIFEKLLIYGAGFGVVYSLSLGVFVYYMLHAICPMCVASYITVISISILSLKMKNENPELI